MNAFRRIPHASGHAIKVMSAFQPSKWDRVYFPVFSDTTIEHFVLRSKAFLKQKK